MPVIQEQEFIDFSNATLDEKVQFIFDLLNRQTNIARYTLEHGNLLNEQVRIYLRFIIVVCNTNFTAAMTSSLENKTYSYADFLSLYSVKLDEQIDELDTDFYVHH